MEKINEKIDNYTLFLKITVNKLVLEFVKGLACLEIEKRKNEKTK